MTSPAYLMRGQVMHARLRPVKHRFVYPVFCVRINLARLADSNNMWFGVNRWRPMSLRTRDYGARDTSSPDTWMRAQLADAGLPNDGDIWLQTFPRLFGIVFNPVSFWYCHDNTGALRAVMAEVNNTFGETHRYLLAGEDGQPITAASTLVCNKVMHVSPFCEVRGTYRFRLRDTATSMFVGIDYDDGNGPLIHTAIGGKPEVLTALAACKALLSQPFMTIGIIVKIHWQAFKLWRMRVPFFRKPDRPSGYTTDSNNFKKDIAS